MCNAIPKTSKAIRNDRNTRTTHLPQTSPKARPANGSERRYLYTDHNYNHNNDLETIGLSQLGAEFVGVANRGKFVHRAEHRHIGHRKSDRNDTAEHQHIGHHKSDRNDTYTQAN